MAVDLVPLVNGQAYAWVDVRVNILGVLLAGITKIEYSESSEITNNYGTGRRPVSRGHGKIEPTASITIDRAELNSLINSIPQKNLIDIPEFDIIVSYLPDSSIPVTDTIKNCRFINNASGGSEGDTDITSDLEILPSHIEWNSLS